MKVVYRGFDINVNREKCMAGYLLLYFSVYRKSDGWEFICSYTEGSDTVRDYVRYMKERVDGFLKEPEGEILQEEGQSYAEYQAELLRHKTENVRTERGQYAAV